MISNVKKIKLSPTTIYISRLTLTGRSVMSIISPHLTYPHIITQDEAGGRLDKVLATVFSQLSRNRLQNLIITGNVKIDNIVSLDPGIKTRAGWQVDIIIPDIIASVPQAEDMALSVVFEDEYLLIVNKPAGMVTHPGAGNFTNTLVNALLFHCRGQLAGIGGVERPGIVHRLDKDTSGLLVIAKTEGTHHGLSAIFASHDLLREYKAIVWGRPNSTAGIIDKPLARSRFNRQKMAIVAGGKKAITHWQLEASFGMPPMASLLNCRLETGRTHQIRVHLTSEGLPLISDNIYGSPPKRALPEIASFPRQALHAWLLAFKHPITGQNMRFESPLPADMQELLNFLMVN